MPGRDYTVFAGHYHNLTLHTRNDRRYFVLGATGGAFTPQQTKEFGAFDHYSIVTVDGGDVGVAIIEPGNVSSGEHFDGGIQRETDQLPHNHTGFQD